MLIARDDLTAYPRFVERITVNGVCSLKELSVRRRCRETVLKREKERERERERHLCPEWHRPIDFPLLASRRVPCVASVVLHLNMAEPCLSLSLLRCACHPSKGEMQEEIEREREKWMPAGK